MIKDEIIRLIEKGKSPDIINSKIKYFHRKDYLDKKYKLIFEYENSLDIISELQEKEEITVIEQEELNNRIEYVTTIEKVNFWLTVKNEFGGYDIPEFSMTDEEVEAYKTENFVEFRKARFMSELGKQFEALYDDVKDSDLMPLFQQININVKEEFKKG